MIILAGYNGTRESRAAVKLAAAHALAFDAGLEIVQTIAQDRQLDYEQIQREEKRLRNDIEELIGGRAPFFKTHLIVTPLSAGEQLVEFAERIGADEIVIGVRRRSKVGKFVFGSDTQFILLKAPCPVLTTG